MQGKLYGVLESVKQLETLMQRPGNSWKPGHYRQLEMY
jgi:hypothetical protein